MRNRSRPLSALFAVLAALALLAAACGDSDDESSGGGGDSGGGDSGCEAGYDLSNADLTVGSKDFTENQIVAEIYAQAVEECGGTVDRNINLGSTQVNREALVNGEIGTYPDYNGTGWTVFLDNEDPSKDPQELYEKVKKDDLEENDIHWLGHSKFNNTYGFATSADVADEVGPFDFQGMADYLENNPDTTLCMEPEFPDRPDGLILFEEATGYTVPDSQIKILESGSIYEQTAEASPTSGCTFGEIFTSDGRIPALDLQLVDDPGVMIIYNISMTMNDATFQQAGDAYTGAAEDVLNNLDQETMTELNRRVDVEGEERGDVAKSYLEDIGYISS